MIIILSDENHETGQIQAKGPSGEVGKALEVSEEVMYWEGWKKNIIGMSRREKWIIGTLDVNVVENWNVGCERCGELEHFG